MSDVVDAQMKIRRQEIEGKKPEGKIPHVAVLKSYLFISVTYTVAGVYMGGCAPL